MKRALVTGGSGDIGAAICRAARARRLHVIVHANGNLAARRRRVARSASSPPAAAPQRGRVRRDRSHAAAQARCEQLLAGGAIQILVNNAGIHDDAVMPGMRADAMAARHRRLAARLLQRDAAAADADDRARAGAASSTSRRSRRSPATAARPTTPPPRPACTAPPSRWRWSSRAAASP